MPPKVLPKRCNESDCHREATHQVVVKANDLDSRIDAFTIPSCEEHLTEIKRIVEAHCVEKDFSVVVESIEK